MAGDDPEGVQSAPDVCVGLQVEDPVPTVRGFGQKSAIEHVAFHQRESRAAPEPVEELAPARPKVVHDDDLGPGVMEGFGQTASDETAPAGDARSPRDHDLFFTALGRTSPARLWALSGFRIKAVRTPAA